MDTAKLDFTLPQELIANTPVHPREDAKMLVYNRNTGIITHSRVGTMGQFLPENCLVVVNESKVFKARVYGRVFKDKSSYINKESTESDAEILIHNPVKNNHGHWQVLVKPGKKFVIGSIFVPMNDHSCEWRVIEILPDGQRILDTGIADETDLFAKLDRVGQMPLPPYIKGFNGDENEYQTPFGRAFGSCASPTASLHFSPEIIASLKKAGHTFCPVTLHVGMGTFLPIKSETLEAHTMHSEPFYVSGTSLGQINRAKNSGRKIIAIGTTAARTLESIDPGARTDCGEFRDTDIFLKPGDAIRNTDILFTNFHLPKSTLLSLVACFLARGRSPEYGIDKLHEIYEEAISLRYRFYSFGDCMLII